MPKKTTRRKSSALKLRPVARNCPFCKEGRNPDYKNAEELGRYITDRAKIVGKLRSGLCAKHQRRTAAAIKRARHLGLLPYTSGL